MSKITQVILKLKDQSFSVFSRKKGDNLEDINLHPYYLNNHSKIILFNCCSRDFIYKGSLPENVIFYDYNYDFSPHQVHFQNQNCDFYDGMELLEKQAMYALEFLKIQK